MAEDPMSDETCSSDEIINDPPRRRLLPPTPDVPPYVPSNFKLIGDETVKNAAKLATLALDAWNREVAHRITNLSGIDQKANADSQTNPDSIPSTADDASHVLPERQESENIQSECADQQGNSNRSGHVTSVPARGARRKTVRLDRGTGQWIPVVFTPPSSLLDAASPVEARSSINDMPAGAHGHPEAQMVQYPALSNAELKLLRSRSDDTTAEDFSPQLDPNLLGDSTCNEIEPTTTAYDDGSDGEGNKNNNNSSRADQNNNADIPGSLPLFSSFGPGVPRHRTLSEIHDSKNREKAYWLNAARLLEAQDKQNYTSGDARRHHATQITDRDLRNAVMKLLSPKSDEATLGDPSPDPTSDLSDGTKRNEIEPTTTACDNVDNEAVSRKINRRLTRQNATVDRPSSLPLLPSISHDEPRHHAESKRPVSENIDPKYTAAQWNSTRSDQITLATGPGARRKTMRSDSDTGRGVNVDQPTPASWLEAVRGVEARRGRNSSTGGAHRNRAAQIVDDLELMEFLTPKSDEAKFEDSSLDPIPDISEGSRRRARSGFRRIPRILKNLFCANKSPPKADDSRKPKYVICRASRDVANTDTREMTRVHRNLVTTDELRRMKAGEAIDPKGADHDAPRDLAWYREKVLACESSPPSHRSTSERERAIPLQRCPGYEALTKEEVAPHKNHDTGPREMTRIHRNLVSEDELRSMRAGEPISLKSPDSLAPRDLTWYRGKALACEDCPPMHQILSRMNYETPVWNYTKGRKKVAVQPPQKFVPAGLQRELPSRVQTTDDDSRNRITDDRLKRRDEMLGITWTRRPSEMAVGESSNLRLSRHPSEDSVSDDLPRQRWIIAEENLEDEMIPLRTTTRLSPTGIESGSYWRPEEKEGYRGKVLAYEDCPPMPQILSRRDYETPVLDYTKVWSSTEGRKKLTVQPPLKFVPAGQQRELPSRVQTTDDDSRNRITGRCRRTLTRESTASQWSTAKRGGRSAPLEIHSMQHGRPTSFIVLDNSSSDENSDDRLKLRDEMLGITWTRRPSEMAVGESGTLRLSRHPSEDSVSDDLPRQRRIIAEENLEDEMIPLRTKTRLPPTGMESGSYWRPEKREDVRGIRTRNHEMSQSEPSDSSAETELCRIEEGPNPDNYAASPDFHTRPKSPIGSTPAGLRSKNEETDDIDFNEKTSVWMISCAIVICGMTILFYSVLEENTDTFDIWTSVLLSCIAISISIFTLLYSITE